MKPLFACGPLIEALEGRTHLHAYTVTALAGGAWRVDGTAGNDWIDITVTGATTFKVDDGTGMPTTHTPASFVQVNGLDGYDSIQIGLAAGATSSIQVDANGGNHADAIVRHYVSGKSEGDADNDSILVYAAPNAISNGGDGDDDIYFLTDAPGYLAHGGNGKDLIDASGLTNDEIEAHGEGGNDTIYGSPFVDNTYPDDLLTGGDGDDEIHGSGGNDEIHGGDANDKLYGDGDNDLIYGDSGNDILEGGNGNDTINAWDGWSDFCDGGSGTDSLDADGVFALEYSVSGFESTNFH